MQQESIAPGHDDTRGLPRSSVLRPLVVLGGAVLTVAIIGALVVLLSGREPAVYEPGTPEAAFQSYLAAWEAGDHEAAYATFSYRIRESTPIATYRRMAGERGWQHEQERRIALVDSRVQGDHASLDLRVDEFSPGALGGNRWSWDKTIILVREDGAWRIDDLLRGLDHVDQTYMHEW
jgi:hypothetical protein